MMIMAMAMAVVMATKGLRVIAMTSWQSQDVPMEKGIGSSVKEGWWWCNEQGVVWFLKVWKSM